jgi:hypothetical protein
MKPPFTGSRIMTATVVLLLATSAAVAQTSDPPRRLSTIVSGALGDGGPAASVSLTGRYRILPGLAIEADVSHVPGLDFGEFPFCPPERICLAIAIRPFTLKGRASSLSANVVADLPLRATWMRPYVALGGGVARLRREANYSLFFTDTKTTAYDPLLSVGAGVDFPIGRRVAVGVDLRHHHVFGEPVAERRDIPHKLNLTRLGSSVSYRF